MQLVWVLLLALPRIRSAIELPESLSRSYSGSQPNGFRESLSHCRSIESDDRRLTDPSPANLETERSHSSQGHEVIIQIPDEGIQDKGRTLMIPTHSGNKAPSMAAPQNQDHPNDVGTRLDEECSICLEEFTDNRATWDCGHSYHQNCLNRWLLTVKENLGPLNNYCCPKCKKILSRDGIPTMAPREDLSSKCTKWSIILSNLVLAAVAMFLFIHKFRK